MGKKVTSVSLTETNREWLEENVKNRSEFVNELIDAHREGTVTNNRAVAKLRERQVRSQLDHVEHKADLLRKELDQIKAIEETVVNSYDEEAEELVEHVENGVRLWPEHKQVQRIAREHTKTPHDVLNDVKRRAEAQGLSTERIEV